MSKRISRDESADGIDRRGFLECMAWAGTGMVWSIAGGVASSKLLGQTGGVVDGFDFVQISDSHIGFNKAANPDVTATLQTAVDRINALPHRPDFLIHTGDLSHLSKPGEFDTLDQVLRTVRTDQRFFVPGEHDVFADNGRQYLDRYGKNTHGAGWYSFDHNGVHFVALVNVVDLKAGGLGALGAAQLEWLRKDLAGQSSSTPVVVFAHIPLWTVYPQWGWGTDDGAQALGYCRRFGSVTVLNGHIHQTMQKLEGNIACHTAASTAFPQPKPGMAASPGPVKVPPGQLASLLGITSVHYIPVSHSLAVVDASLGSSGGEGARVSIDNFAFTPKTLRLPPGTNVTWTNQDDVPHNVESTEKKFSSALLDTGEHFTHRFDLSGVYKYYCKLHPMMTGEIVITEVTA